MVLTHLAVAGCCLPRALAGLTLQELVDVLSSCECSRLDGTLRLGNGWCMSRVGTMARLRPAMKYCRSRVNLTILFGWHRQAKAGAGCEFALGSRGSRPQLLRLRNEGTKISVAMSMMVSARPVGL